MTSNSFGPVAPFYDELMASVPYRMWVGYLLLLFSHQDVHPRKLLDVCCGTGTMCEMLTNEDCELSGFDLSQSMIDTARVKAKRKKLNIRYECQDAADFEMGETYDAAYSFFDSLNYITDTDQLRSAIKQVAKHLRPGGSFIFDLNTAYAFEADLFTQEDMKEKSKVRYKWVSDWNPETRIIKVQMRFWYEGDEYEEVHIQRAHTDEEIRSYLEEAGFQDTQAFHSYSLNKPRAKSDRIHYATRLG